MKPYNFQEYEIITFQNKNKKWYKKILILLIIGIVLIISNYKFKIYDKVLLIKEDNNYHLLSSITTTIDNKTLNIDGKEYNYEIIDSENDIINTNGTIYKNTAISIDKYNSNDNYKYIYLLKTNKTFIEMITEYIGGTAYE